MRSCLIVDDSAVMRKLARRDLEALGFICSEAHDGEQALAIASDGPPSMILLDWEMPVLDGLGALKRIRASDWGSNIPVLMCTTLSDPSRIAQALEAGADEYIMKPWSLEILQGKLEDVGILPK